MEYSQEYYDMIEQAAPHLIDFAKYIETLSEESDRGAVLITASMLDDALTRLLAARLVKGKGADKLLTGFNAPLGTFSAKIAAAHAVGAISDDWRRELNFLREIRNDFAHKLKVSFSDASIRSKCNELRLFPFENAIDNETARRKYVMSAQAIIFNILNALQADEVTRIPFCFESS